MVEKESRRRAPHSTFRQVRSISALSPFLLPYSTGPCHQQPPPLFSLRPSLVLLPSRPPSPLSSCRLPHRPHVTLCLSHYIARSPAACTLSAPTTTPSTAAERKCRHTHHLYIGPGPTVAGPRLPRVHRHVTYPCRLHRAARAASAGTSPAPSLAATVLTLPESPDVRLELS